MPDPVAPIVPATPVTPPAAVVTPPVTPPAAPPVAVTPPVTATPPAAATPPPATPAAPTGTLMSEAAKPPEAAKTEAKPGEAAAPATELKLAIPANSQLNQADVDSVLTLAKAQGLNQKQAEAVLADRQAVLTQADASFRASAEVFKKDPEYGGANLPQSQQAIRRVLNSPLMPPDLKQILSDPRLPFGDLAPLAKFMTNIGKLLGEDGMIPVNAQGNAKADIPIAHKFYPPKSASKAG